MDKNIDGESNEFPRILNLSVSGVSSVSSVSAVDTAINTVADAIDATVNMISEA